MGNERIEGEGGGLIREGKNRINRDKYWLSEWTGRGIYIYIKEMKSNKGTGSSKEARRVVEGIRRSERELVYTD